MSDDLPERLRAIAKKLELHFPDAAHDVMTIHRAIGRLADLERDVSLAEAKAHCLTPPKRRDFWDWLAGVRTLTHKHPATGRSR